MLAATDYVTACFEVIDSRIVDWRIRIQDTVADNGSSARVLLGSRRIRPADLALDGLDTVLSLDGVAVETGNTGAILGHPANGIAWLANNLAAYGVTLEPGAIVLPGTCTRCRRVAGHRRIHGSIVGLGEVELALERAPTVDHSAQRPGADRMRDTTAAGLEATIRRYFDGCNEADAAKITGCMEPDAVHYFPAGAPQGTFVGAQAIADRLAARRGEPRLDLDDRSCPRRRVAARGRHRMDALQAEAVALPAR